MTYDLAVWVGEAPVDEAAARAEFERRYASFDAGAPPSPPIRRFVEEALEIFPGLDEIDDEDPEAESACPWASAPLLDEAGGDFIYFPLTFPGAVIAGERLEQLAREHGLVFFDPQIPASVGADGSGERSAPRTRRSWWPFRR